MTPDELSVVRQRLEAFAVDVFTPLVRSDQRVKGETYLRGLLVDGRRKSMQPMADRLVYDCPDDDGIRHVGHILNPDIELPADSSRRLVEATEGCLSVPGAGHSVARPDRAVAQGVDLHGNPIRIAGTGYFARCLLHETDHVDGTLYIDRLSTRNRRAVMQEMSENRDQVFAERAARATAMGKEPAVARSCSAVSSKDLGVG